MKYSQIIISKNNLEIPVFSDGQSMHSKYNPLNEAAAFENGKQSGCYIIGGLGGGYHLNALAQKENTLLIVYESDTESLEFCKQIENVKKLTELKNIIFCTLENLSETILQNYIPLIHGPLNALNHIQWQKENSEVAQKAVDSIKRSIELLTIDYSTQGHFGSLWQRNILLNLKQTQAGDLEFTQTDSSRIAAIVAAGPSLDSSINKIIEERNTYTVFSTDTAFGTLLANGIRPEFVVSIDSQQISRTHFLSATNHLKEKDFQGITFIFDLASNPVTVEYVKSHGGKILFTRSNHPLLKLSPELLKIPQLDSGNGTVTVSACDAARQLGFTKLELFGADFCNNSNKAYCRGTYLEGNSIPFCNKLSTQENFYSNIYFRSALEEKTHFLKSNEGLLNPRTTKVFDSYQDSLENWILKNEYHFEEKILVTKKQCKIPQMQINFSYNDFMDELVHGITRLLESKNLLEESNKPYLFALLPYVSYLQAKQNSNSTEIRQLLKLAYSRLLCYTNSYEK